MIMASGCVKEDGYGMPKNLRAPLAVAVRSIQWSYAIFWSSISKPGVLEWADGYYNGDIKTRKTVQAVEPNIDKIGPKRSEQLRDLYKALLEGETEQQPAKRPSAALSPEDLTDAEWYYLVCMSFTFNISQSLPGKALADGESIWLCNAQYADSKVFCRSLLAKSASIQTVLCFPHAGGVIEIGTTELVPEDSNLLQHIKACLLDVSKPVCSDNSSSFLHEEDNDKDPACTKFGHETVDTLVLENICSPTEDIIFKEYKTNELPINNNDELNMCSPDECSEGCDHQCHTEDSFMLEGVNGVASQGHSWHFMDDDLSNGILDSMNSSDCISEAFVNQEKANEYLSRVHLRELQDCNHSKLSSLYLVADGDLSYKRTLSAILGNSTPFTETAHTQNPNQKSSFTIWKKGEFSKVLRPLSKQNMLKKILFTVPLMHGGFSPVKSQEEDGRTEEPQKTDNVDKCAGNFLSDNGRNLEKFVVLRSIVPSVKEMDKISILNDTIKYLKELEARVEELESCMDSSGSEARCRRKHLNMAEHISDNYNKNKIQNEKRHWINKRKASDVDESELKHNNGIVPQDGQPLDVKVSMKEQEVLIEMTCHYREYILLDIMDAINNLHLDAHMVQSSTLDGILTLTLKSKFRGAAVAPVGMIKAALCKVSGKY